MKILVAEDDPLSRHLLVGLLSKWGYEVISARDGTEAWKILARSGAPRLAILDWMMPGADGVELCRRLRNAQQDLYTYVLLLTARSELDDVLEGLAAGADDYLRKPVHPQELRARLHTGERILDLQQRLLQASEQNRYQATHDALTGLLNRAAILDFFDRELARSGREGGSVAVLMADIDHFKIINDTRGHMAGDVVLREAARRMACSLRPYDAIGRYGGEEFLVIAPGCEEPGEEKLAERLRANVCRSAIEVESGGIEVTVSVGYTIASGEGLMADELIRAADKALYAAKEAGRNCCRSQAPQSRRQYGAAAARRAG